MGAQEAGASASPTMRFLNVKSYYNIMGILFAFIAGFMGVNVILLAIIIGELRSIYSEIRYWGFSIESDIRKAHPKAFDRHNKDWR